MKPKLQTSEDWIAHVKNAFGRAEKCQSKLSDEILEMNGLSGTFTRHFYNNICSFHGCSYLEIGPCAGSSLCSSMYDNEISGVAIDNWSEFGGPRDIFLENHKKYRGRSDITLIDQDSFTVDASQLGRFNVFLYDGGHGWLNHYKAINHYYNNLEKCAIVIIDDWNWDGVQIGTKKAIEELDIPIIYDREIILAERDLKDMPRHHGRHTWWNGIYVFIIDKTLV